uniref:Protein YIPF n=1 Tax=Meloidogyne enterolobii TaxID=390850 RepID=A0A6V7UUF8_MELEN|nr:unnamed protein product [Meloidogyne enterolobii]
MDADLNFKDFSKSTDPSNSSQSMSGMLLDGSSIQKDSSSESGGSKSHFLSISYYQRFFDVDEETVFARILNSCIPRRTGNFIADFVQPLPDLWGPFWISVTLVFSIAIVGNFANFLQVYGNGQEEFQSDFSFVTGATSLIFGYVLLLPFAIYTYLWYHRAAGLQYSFFDILCAYGYSLSLFVPVSILCPLIPFNWVRWTLLISAAVFSGSVLIISIWAMVKDDPNRFNAFGLCFLVFAAHALLAICLKEFFFDSANFPSDVEPVIKHVTEILNSTTPQTHKNSTD